MVDEAGAETAARRLRQSAPLTTRTISTNTAGEPVERVEVSPDRRLKIEHTSVAPGGEPVVTTRVGQAEVTQKKGIRWQVRSFLDSIHWPRSGS